MQLGWHAAYRMRKYMPAERPTEGHLKGQRPFLGIGVYEGLF